MSPTALPSRNIPSTSEARLMLAAIALIALAGAAWGWNGARFPEPLVRTTDNAASLPTVSDMQLYREIVSDVHAGQDYYASANARLSQHSFPRSSPFNWRLPTYAWVWSLLPDPVWIRALFIGLSVAALGLAYYAQTRAYGSAKALVTMFLLIGVVSWSIDGDAYLTQEVWAATLLVISISALVLRWSWLALAAGLAALFFRELALPYCVIAAAVLACQRRWVDAACWSAGIVLFFAFFAWHIGQVHAQLQASAAPSTSSLAQWLQFGGFDFDLLTVRLNALLYRAPAVVLWLYLLGSLIGLGRQKDTASMIAGLTVASYLAAFALIGRPWNFYWGLMYAPLLPWGIVQAPKVLKDLWVAARANELGQALRLPHECG